MNAPDDDRSSGLAGASAIATDGSAGPWHGDSYASRLDAPAAPEDAGPDPEAGPRYTPGMELGRGAMGHVRLVRDRHLVRDLAWKEGAAHVLREARITAQLEHPGILPVHDLGATPDGQSYFAMRAVRGRTLAAVLYDLHHPTPAARAAKAPAPGAVMPLLRSLLQAVQAVAWAHHRGVVHRDLKPSNIMLGPFGEVLVIDWGLALVLEEAEAPLSPEARAAIATLPIPADAIVGTPRYMAPEQARGRVDRRADVWALGCVLFETLAGSPPREDPSQAPRALGDVAPATPLELQAIVTRALALDPADRYPDARALADDLSAFLDGRRVDAYAYRTRDHLRRFARAFRLPLAIGLAALVALGVFGLVAVERVAAERDLAVASEGVAQRARAAADHALAEALVGEARRLAREGLRPEAEAAALRALALVDHPEARGVIASFAASPGPRALSATTLPPCAELELGGATRVLCRERDGLRVLELGGDGSVVARWSHTTRALLAGLADDGRRVVEGGRHAPLVVHELATGGRATLDPRGCAGAERMTIAGRYALVTNPLCATIADTVTGETRALDMCTPMHASTITADGAWVVVCAGGDVVRGASLDAPAVRVEVADYARPENQPAAVGLLAGGALLVVDTRGRLEVRTPDGARVRRIDAMTGMARLVAPSPDGRWVAVAGDTGSVYLYDLPGLGLHATLPAEDGARLAWLESSERGARFVTIGRRADLPILRAWELGEGPAARHTIGEGVVALAIDDDESRLLVGHEAAATIVELAAGSRHVALGGDGQGVKGALFDRRGRAYVGTHRGGLTRSARHASGVASGAASEPLGFPGMPTRRYVAAADWIIAAPYGQSLRAARADALDAPVVLEADVPEDRAAYWLDLDESPVGGHFVAALRGGLVREVVVPPEGPPATRVVGADPDAVAVAPFVHGAWVAIAGAERVAVRATDGFALVSSLEAAGAELLEVATEPTGRLVAAGARDGAVFVWDVAAAEPLLVWRGHDARVVTLVFFDGGARLATGSWDGVVALLDLDAARGAAALGALGYAARWGRQP